MAVFNEPTQWGTSLVVNGDTNVIPQSTPAGSGALSFDDGFPQITQVPLGAGGIAPDRKDFNAVMKLLGDAVFYMQNGGLWSYSNKYDYVTGRVVLYTDGYLYLCIQANGISSTVIAPDDVNGDQYWSKIPTLADLDEISFKTGDIKIQTTSNVPNGWLLCNGAGISRTTFSNLFAEIGTTYGTGDGSTTFNIPDLRDRYIIGADTNALGTKIAEQLPNIRGMLDHGGGDGAIINWNGAEDLVSGALDVITKSRKALTANGLATMAKAITFSASASNNTYTDSGKVYPLSLALNFIIKT